MFPADRPLPHSCPRVAWGHRAHALGYRLRDPGHRQSEDRAIGELFTAAMRMLPDDARPFEAAIAAARALAHGRRVEAGDLLIDFLPTWLAAGDIPKAPDAIDDWRGRADCGID